MSGSDMRALPFSVDIVKGETTKRNDFVIIATQPTCLERLPGTRCLVHSEAKQEFIAMLKQSSYSNLALELDINPSTIWRWKWAVRKHLEESPDNASKQTPVIKKLGKDRQIIIVVTCPDQHLDFELAPRGNLLLESGAKTSFKEWLARTKVVDAAEILGISRHNLSAVRKMLDIKEYTTTSKQEFMAAIKEMA